MNCESKGERRDDEKKMITNNFDEQIGNWIWFKKSDLVRSKYGTKILILIQSKPTRPDPTRPDPTRPDPTRPDSIRPIEMETKC